MGPRVWERVELVDIRIGRDDAEGTPWSVLSDLAITIVLVLVVFIVLQFVQTFRERAITAELANRQRIVREAIVSAAGTGDRVTIDSLAPDRQRLSFSSELLFDECKATLRPEGVALLMTVGQALGRGSQYFEAVQIEGHTDRRPIRRSALCPYGSNWELSSARATRVVTLYSAEGVVANQKLSAIGKAEFHPVDTINLGPNRRIDMLLQYDRRGVAALLMGPTRSEAASGGSRPWSQHAAQP